MKIQCNCGAKYSFDVTPEMAQSPIRFVCPSCGLDSSDAVNQMIRAELGAPAEAPRPRPPVATVVRASSGSQAPVATLLGQTPTPPAPAAVAASLVPTPPSTSAPRVRLQGSKPAAEAAEPASPDAPAARMCRKHPNIQATHECLVCHNPICPKCMELFGYVCSPLCNAKAEAQGIDIPVFAGQRSVVERKHWRKVGAVSALIALFVLGLFGAWFWYAWIGSRPRPVYSVQFADPSAGAQSILCGSNQIVVLKGTTLSRHDFKAKKQVWSIELADPQEISNAVSNEMASMQAIINQAKREASGRVPKMPSPDELKDMVMTAMVESMQLHVSGQNVWVVNPGSAVRYDWNTGKQTQEVAFRHGFGELREQDGELVSTGLGDSGGRMVARLNLATGDVQTESLGEPVRTVLAAGSRKGGAAGAKIARGQATAGLPTGTGRDAGKPLDPSRVAEEVQRLPAPAKIALPATLSAQYNQERAMAEIDDTPTGDVGGLDALMSDIDVGDRDTFVPSKHGYMQLTAKLIEKRLVTVKAMKDPPKKSALDDTLTVTRTAEVANEILNEIQRNRGGDTITENQSRYQVTVRKLDAKDVPDWTGEIVGPPGLYPLKSVSVIAGGKMLVVLDKSNKKIWQAALTYSMPERFNALFDEVERYGEGPCVERGDALYVYDKAVLTAFDLATGNVRWRLPSVGIAGLLFDDQGMLYVNTTTAGMDSVKFSKQIDVTRNDRAIVLKIEPKTGKTLWKNDPGGYVSYLSGKYIYVVDSYRADDSDPDDPYKTGLETPSHVMIMRLNPKNGKVMWEYDDKKRGALDVQFNGNVIQLVFRKEVQVLKFLSF